MFYLFLESLLIYGNLDDKTQLLVYTSTPFMNKIKQSQFYCDKMIFEINDTYDTVNKACRARLDLFQFQSITKYNKILYLDTDIIVKNDINKIFDVCNEDILYVLEEGLLTWYDDFYGGKTLFGDEINNYQDITAFTSGILLFNNCEKMKFLFEKINEDIVNRPHDFGCHDQPYFVYNAFKYNLYDNKALKIYAANNDYHTDTDIIIHHFPMGAGDYKLKMNNMSLFLYNIKDITINNIITQTKKYIEDSLFPIINNCQELLEGNIFTLHHTNVFTDVYANKVKNISNILLNKNIKKIMEIGFNSGFSSLLMLLSNPEVKITCIDLGEHKYTIPCYEKIKETFGDRINIIIGDSTKTVSSLKETYDLIHIDGGHSIDVATSDIIESYRLSRDGTIFIMDDYDFLQSLWDKYVYIYNLSDLNISSYQTPHHSIKYRKNNINYNPLKNKSYKWQNHSITFFENFNMHAFGCGNFFYIDSHRINAYFGGQNHLIQFNENYSKFTSIRKYDLQVICGDIL
jgi:predicted O-methyltransferase YrrM